MFFDDLVEGVRYFCETAYKLRQSDAQAAVARTVPSGGIAKAMTDKGNKAKASRSSDKAATAATRQAVKQGVHGMAALDAGDRAGEAARIRSLRRAVMRNAPQEKQPGHVHRAKADKIILKKAINKVSKR